MRLRVSSWSNVILDEPVGGGQFFFQERDLSVQAGAQDWTGQFPAVAHGDELIAYLPAVIEQFAQGDRRLIHRGVQPGLDFFAEAAEQSRVEPVGLGQQAFGVGEGAHAAGIDDTDFELGEQERRDDRAFVAAGGFALIRFYHWVEHTRHGGTEKAAERFSRFLCVSVSLR